MTTSVRMRRAIPLVLLTVVSILMLLFGGLRLARASLEMRNLRRVQAGEAVGVRPWMTIPYIAHTYGVPEDEVFAALHLPDTRRNRRAPLQVIAAHEGHDLDADIATLNALIDARKTVRPSTTPRQQPSPGLRSTP